MCVILCYPMCKSFTQIVWCFTVNVHGAMLRWTPTVAGDLGTISWPVRRDGLQQSDNLHQSNIDSLSHSLIQSKLPTNRPWFDSRERHWFNKTGRQGPPNMCTERGFERQLPRIIQLNACKGKVKQQLATWQDICTELWVKQKLNMLKTSLVISIC